MDDEPPPGEINEIKCTKTACIIKDNDPHFLTCSVKVCSRSVHYSCTELPLYQLQHFLIRGYRKYICSSCTKISPHLKEIKRKNDPGNYCETEQELKTIINGKSMEVDVLVETNGNLVARINELEKELSNKMSVIKKGSADYNKLQNELKDLTNEMISSKTKMLELENNLKVQSMGSKFEAVDSEHVNLKHDFDSLKTECESYKDTIDELKKTNVCAETELNRVNDSLVAIKTDKTVLQGKIVTLKDENWDLKKKNKEIKVGDRYTGSKKT